MGSLRVLGMHGTRAVTLIKGQFAAVDLHSMLGSACGGLRRKLGLTQVCDAC
jgi:hypothetical protein